MLLNRCGRGAFWVHIRSIDQAGRRGSRQGHGRAGAQHIDRDRGVGGARQPARLGDRKRGDGLAVIDRIGDRPDATRGSDFPEELHLRLRRREKRRNATECDKCDARDASLI